MTNIHAEFEMTLWRVINLSAKECGFQAMSFEVDWADESDVTSAEMMAITFSILKINKVYTLQIANLEGYSMRAVIATVAASFTHEESYMTTEKGWHVKKI